MTIDFDTKIDDDFEFSQFIYHLLFHKLHYNTLLLEVFSPMSGQSSDIWSNKYLKINWFMGAESSSIYCKQIKEYSIETTL